MARGRGSTHGRGELMGYHTETVITATTTLYYTGPDDERAERTAVAQTSTVLTPGQQHQLGVSTVLAEDDDTVVVVHAHGCIPAPADPPTVTVYRQVLNAERGAWQREQ